MLEENVIIVESSELKPRVSDVLAVCASHVNPLALVSSLRVPESKLHPAFVASQRGLDVATGAFVALQRLLRV